MTHKPDRMVQFFGFPRPIAEVVFGHLVKHDLRLSLYGGPDEAPFIGEGVDVVVVALDFDATEGRALDDRQVLPTIALVAEGQGIPAVVFLFGAWTYDDEATLAALAPLAIRVDGVGLRPVDIVDALIPHLEALAGDDGESASPFDPIPSPWFAQHPAAWPDEPPVASPCCVRCRGLVARRPDGQTLPILAWSMDPAPGLEGGAL